MTPGGLFLTPAGRESLATRLTELETLAQSLLRQLADGNTDDVTAVTYGRAAEEIVCLTTVLKAARSMDELPPYSCCVVLGDTVTLYYPDGESGRDVIVAPLEAPVEDRRISSDSPLGWASSAVTWAKWSRSTPRGAEGDRGRYRCRIASAERR